MQQKPAKPRYIKGQKVIIKPAHEAGVTQREDSVNEYAGQMGEISSYYWISPRSEQVFYIYKVKVGKDGAKKEIVVYEDELVPALR
jgi:hypothetical protein